MLQLPGRHLGSRKRDDRALLGALVSEGHAIDSGEFPAQCCGKQPDPLADCSQSPGEGIVDGDPESELSSIVAFPALKAFGIPAQLVVSAREQWRSVMIELVGFELFEQRIPGVEPAVLPNGVDVAHFTTGGDDEREPHTAIFTGVMDYEPNVDGVCWFAERCWPALRERFPAARLLAGRFKITGIDISPVQIERAKKLFVEGQKKAELGEFEEQLKALALAHRAGHSARAGAELEILRAVHPESLSGYWLSPSFWLEPVRRWIG